MNNNEIIEKAKAKGYVPEKMKATTNIGGIYNSAIDSFNLEKIVELSYNAGIEKSIEVVEDRIKLFKRDTELSEGYGDCLVDVKLELKTLIKE